MSLSLDSIDHVVLTVRDVDATVSFYSHVLGMELAILPRGQKALRFGGQQIMLHRQGSDVAPKAQRPTPGSADLCFVTALSVGKVMQHLSSCGVAIVDGPVQRVGATGPILSVFVRDPDSNLIEIANRLADRVHRLSSVRPPG